MSMYFVGDIHGCYKNLKTILNIVHFSPSTDTLYLTGDLVARGPSSLKVLRLIHTLGNSAYTVLGNHDLHLLKTYFGIENYKKPNNYFDHILNAPDINKLMYWLRHQSILYINNTQKILMSHAGISPNWNINQAKKYAQEIELILSSNDPSLLFKKKYKKNKSNNSKHNVYPNNKFIKIQNNINIFTRMRYVYSSGKLDLKYKHTPEDTPDNLYPWFTLPSLIIPEYSIIFGHWASLANIKTPSNIYGLDSGCCWGGKLTLLRWDNKELIKIPCSPPA